VQLRVGVAGEGDETQLGVILAHACDRGDAVDERHVQVDHDCVR